MGEVFTDNIDNTFSDTFDNSNTGQETQPPADSSNVPDTLPDNTGTSDSVEITVTPTPSAESDIPTSGEDSEHEPNDENDATHAVGVADIYTLLADLREDNEDYQKNVAEYQTQTLENQNYIMEQTKSILSVSSLLLLTVGFISGILLARIVWRKL